MNFVEQSLTIEGLIYNTPSQNREKTAVGSTVETITWPTPVREVRVTVAQEVAGTPNLQASLAICFDAPSDLVAATWLASADSGSTNSKRVLVMAGESRVFAFDNPGVSRMDIVRNYGSETLNVIVEAA